MKKTHQGKKLLTLMLTAALLCVTAAIGISVSASGIETVGEMVEIKADFEAFAVQKTARIENDGVVGALQYTIYYDHATFGDVVPGYYGTPIVVYTVNTSTVRTGTDSNKEIITSMLERGYAVVVLDYLQSERAISPKLDESVQYFVRNMKNGQYFLKDTDADNSYAFPASGTYYELFVCPSGHNVLLNQVFWEIDKHSADGTLEKIVENWNTDFKTAKASKLVKWATGDTVDTRKTVAKAADGSSPVWYNASGTVDANGLYTKVKYTVATTFTDCVDPDGSPLEMDLYLHLVYPTSPAEPVPVITVSSCAGFPHTQARNIESCAHHTGALFNGYAGAVYDYLWEPMGRDASFGYYDGSQGSTGDHMNYSLHIYNDKLVNTAAMRYLRYVSLADTETYNFAQDKFSTIGLSKGGWFSFLGEAVLQSNLVNAASYGTTEELEEAINDRLAGFTPYRILEGHNGETRYQAGNTETYEGGTYIGEYAVAGGELQPWLTYNGKEILSGVQFTYAANGAQEEDVSAGHSPMYITAHLYDDYNAAYGSSNVLVNLSRSLNIPSQYFVVPLPHQYAYGPDEDYGVDTYVAFFDFLNYYMKDAPAKVLYTYPINGSGEVSVNDNLIIKFAGEVSASEIAAVTVTAGGVAVSGVWESAYGDTEWTFITDEYVPDTEYTVNVPATLKGKNGVELGEAYTATFFTECGTSVQASVLDNYYTVTAPEMPEGCDSFIFRFFVANDAANVAQLYAVSAVGDAEGELIGSVNLRGRGGYGMDITDYLSARTGQECVLMLKAKRTIGDTVIMSQSFDGTIGSISPSTRASASSVMLDSDNNEVTDSTVAARHVLKVYVNNNSGSYPGSVFFQNVTSAFVQNNLIGNSNLTLDDYGRSFTVKLSVYDTVSRTLQLRLNTMTKKANGTIDLEQPLYNVTTVAGKWIDVEIPYAVYDTDYGKVSNVKKSLTVYVSPTGESKMPIYFDDLTVTETVTDISVTVASVNATADGTAPYKAPAAEAAFTVYSGSEEVGTYGTWAAALGAAKSGYTVRLNADYTLTNSALYSGLGSLSSVTVDLNGYTLTAANTSNSPLWLKNTSATIATTAITVKNGGIVLGSTPLISYEGSTASGKGKSFDITVENICFTLSRGAMTTEIVTASTIGTGVATDVDVTLRECKFTVGERERADVFVTVLPSGTGDLDVSYSVYGGSFAFESHRRAAIQTGSVYSELYEGNNGYPTMTLSSASEPDSSVSYLVSQGFASYEPTQTVKGVTTYSLTVSANSTRYGIIPDEYADAEAYPLVVFRDGVFIGAYSTWAKASAGLQSAVNSADYLSAEAQLLLRRDYHIIKGDNGTVFNKATNAVLDLGGNVLTQSGIGFDLSGTYSSAPYVTTLKIMNGTILNTRGLAFFDSQYAANQSIAKRYEVIADNVTFGFAEGADTSYQDNMLWVVWNNNRDCLGVENDIVFNNCTFNLRDNLPTDVTASAPLYILNAYDGYDRSHLTATFRGGKFITAGSETVRIMKSNSGSDSFVFDVNESGEYPTLTVTGDYEPLSGDFSTADGKYVYFANGTVNGSDTVYTVKENTLITEYGVIPAEYEDSEAYPFAVFDTNGSFLYAASSFYGANASDSAVGRAIYDVLSANVWNSSAKTYGSSQVGAVILMRRDYTLASGEAFDYLAYAQGTLTIDLGGFTLTQNSNYTFNIKNYSWASSGDAAIFPSTFVVKNGTLGNLTKAHLLFDSRGVSSTVDFSDKKVVWEFDNVTMAVLPGGTTNGVLMGCYFNDKYVARIPHEIILRDCTFDLRNTTVAAPRVFSNLASRNLKMDISVYGGEIHTKEIDSTSQNIVRLDTSNPSELKGTVTFYRDESGNYTKLYLLSSATNEPQTECTLDYGKGVYVNVGEIDGERLYKLVMLTTEYGEIPTEYASAEDYPFAVFKNGEFLGAYALWGDTDDSNVNSALERAKNQMHGKNGAGITVTILLRRDYSNSTKYYNLAQIGGTLVVDLGGYTMTSTDWMLFQLTGKRVLTDGVYYVHDTDIVIKNGELRTGNKVIAAVDTLGTFTEEEYGVKNFNLTFENVTIGNASGYTPRVPFLCDTTTTNPISFNASFKDCTFDYSNAGSTSFKIFDFEKTGNVCCNIEICGGSFIAPSFASITLAALNDDDKLVFAKDSSGSYTRLLVASGKAPEDEFETKDEGKLSFALVGTENSYKVYTLYDLNTPYGKIDPEYADANKYPFIVFDKNGFRYAATAFYGVQSSESAISRAIYQINKVNTYDPEIGGYGEGAQYAVILLRRDYTVASTEKHDNLAHNQGEIIIDLGGYTLTSSADKYLFAATAKRWPDSDDSYIFPCFYNVKNGTLVATNKSLIAFDTSSSGTYDLSEKIFTYKFENVTFKIASGGTVKSPLFAAFYKTGISYVPTYLIYNDCTFDFRGVSSQRRFINVDPGHDIQYHITVNGGELIADSIAMVDVKYWNTTNGSTLSFGKGSSGYLTVKAARGESVPYETFDTVQGEASFALLSDTAEGSVHSLVPTVLQAIVPKISVSLYSDFIFNVYVPAGSGVTSISLGGIAADIASLDVIELDGNSYYKVTCSLAASEAARTLQLVLGVRLSNGDNVSGRWTLSIPEYARTVLASDTATEAELALMTDMLAYVRAAYIYFEKADADTVAAQILDIIGDYTAAAVPGAASGAVLEGLSGASMYLGASPAFVFYPERAEDGALKYSADNYVFTQQGRVLDTEVCTDAEGYTYIKVYTYAYGICDNVCYTVSNTDISGEYGIADYYAYAKSLGNDALVSLVEAFYRYSLSAKSYRESVIAQ